MKSTRNLKTLDFKIDDPEFCTHIQNDLLSIFHHFALIYRFTVFLGDYQIFKY